MLGVSRFDIFLEVEDAFFESEAYVIFNDISNLILVMEAIRYLIIGDESFCTFQQKA